MVNDFANTNRGITEINNNDIDGTFRGITVYFRDSVKIDGNTIDYKAATTGGYPIYGIGVTSSDSSFVSNNVITDAIAGSNNRVGIGFNSGMNSVVCNNHVSGMNIGIAFVNGYQDATMELNIMEGADSTGLLLDSAATWLGQQGDSAKPSDNQWYTSNTWASVLIGSDGEDSPFWVRDTLNFHPTPNFAFPLDPLELHFTEGDTAVCGDSLLLSKWNELGSQLPIGLSSSLRRSFTGTYSIRDWIQDKSTLRYIYENEIDTINPLVRQFINRLRQTSIQNFVTVEQIIARLFDSNLNENQFNAHVFRAIAINGSSLSRFSIEDYHAEANEIYLNTWAVGIDTFTQNQVEALRFIAALCYSQAGDATYKARVMLFSVDTNAFETLCNESLAEKTPYAVQVSSEVDARFILHPNPTEELLYVDCIGDNEIEALLTLTNLTGRKVFERIINCSTRDESLHIGMLHSGIYIASISLNEKTLHKEKLFIFK